MCDQRERVLDYLYDEATDASRRDMERHLESCDGCRDELRAMRSVRQDLLAWAVPNPPSVWTPFAPVAVVPWYRQVPAWAMAAAASVMFVMGSAGGFAAYALGARGTDAIDASGGTPPTAVALAPALDAEAVGALVRRELASAAPVAVVPAAAPASRLDAATEQRLLSRATQLVGLSEERQLRLLQGYLYELGRDADRQRRDDGQTLTALKAQVDQLQAVLSQLVQQQMKVQ
jgi:hypothetical protein